jgi:hypothetical protein
VASPRTDGNPSPHAPPTRYRPLRGVVIICVLGLAAYGGYHRWYHRMARPKNTLGPRSAALPHDKATVNLAFILLATPGLPKSDEIVSAFASFASEEQHLLQRESEAKKPSKIEVLEFELRPGGKVFVVAMPMPVPNGEADSAARFSIDSYRTGWKLPPHTAHLVVTLQGTDSSSEVASLSSFTSLLAAIAQASHAVGVYWGGAGATHSAEYFISTARSPGIVPRITLWNGVSVVRKENGRMSLRSHGMTQLNLPDLLLVATSSAGDDALKTFFDLLGRVAERGEQLPEGDTVGRTADEKLRVKYVASRDDPTKKVCCVELK